MIPTFTKLGAKQALPGWLSALGLQMIFPGYFDNDANRAMLPNLPAAARSVLYSSDHSGGTGYIGRTDFDNIEGAWTDSGGFIHSAANQRETPHPVYDAANNRVNVYVHDATSSVTAGTQAARLLTTTDLVTLTDQGEIHPYGQHTGYGRYEFRNGTWHGVSILAGGEMVISAYSTSADGETFTLQQEMFHNQSHVVGPGKLLGGDPVIFEHEGQWYLLSNLHERPRLAFPREPLAIIAVPIDYDGTSGTMRPTGGYHTLIEPGSGADPDVLLENHFQWIVIGGTPYILYTGIDGNGDTSICVAKGTASPAPYVQSLWPINSDGSLLVGNTQSAQLAWDATAETVPSGVVKSVVSASDISTFESGTGYRIKFGSNGGVYGYLRLRHNKLFRMQEFESVEIEVATEHLIDSGQTDILFGFSSGITANQFTGSGAFARWPGLGSDVCPMRLMSGGAFLSDDPSYALGLRETQWPKTQAWTYKLRVHNYGRRLTAFVGGAVVYHRDLEAEGFSWTNGVYPFLELAGHATSEWLVTGVSVNTFQSTPGSGASKLKLA